MQSGLLRYSHHSSPPPPPPPPPFLPNLHPSWPSRISALYSSTYLHGALDRVRIHNSGAKERRLTAGKRSRRWWSDDAAEELAPGLLEEFLDNMWFFKVLESYGWMLPFIILSWLAASGPKAFLMSFSVPLGLSVLTYVFKKLSRWIQSSTDYKPTRATDMENVMVEEEEREIQWKSKQRTRHQSDSVTSNGAPSFGGWEDLIDERELRRRRARRPSRATERTSVPLEERMKELKTRVEGERDLPLLLKLLVAVFPFLSSWTDLL